MTDTVVVVSDESATTENESTETSDEDIVVPVISPNIVLTSDILLSTCNNQVKHVGMRKGLAKESLDRSKNLFEAIPAQLLQKCC